jgi:hypothetical protein
MSEKSDCWVITAQVTTAYKVTFNEPVTKEEAAYKFLNFQEDDTLDEYAIGRSKVLEIS